MTKSSIGHSTSSPLAKVSSKVTASEVPREVSVEELLDDGEVEGRGSFEVADIFRLGTFTYESDDAALRRGILALFGRGLLSEESESVSLGLVKPDNIASTSFSSSDAFISIGISISGPRLLRGEEYGVTSQKNFSVLLICYRYGTPGRSRRQLTNLLARIGSSWRRWQSWPLR